MPGFEEEALERARQMSHNRQRQRREEQPKPEPKPEPPVPEPKPESPKPTPKPAQGVLQTLLKDKESGLIMLLLLILMDESNDPSLLFALMYLLI